MKKTGIFFLLCQFTGWFFFTIYDFIDEMGRGGGQYALEELVFVFNLILPFVIIWAYILFMNKAKYRAAVTPEGEPVWRPLDEKGWKYKALSKLLWLGIGVLFLLVFYFLSEKDLWIVPQATGGWENFLNGIEYYVFGILSPLVCLAGFLLYDIGRGVFRWYRKRKS